MFNFSLKLKKEKNFQNGSFVKFSLQVTKVSQTGNSLQARVRKSSVAYKENQEKQDFSFRKAEYRKIETIKVVKSKPNANSLGLWSHEGGAALLPSVTSLHEAGKMCKSRQRWRSLPQLHVKNDWAEDMRHPCVSSSFGLSFFRINGSKEEKCQIICRSLGPCDMQARERRDHPGSFEKK